MHEAHASRKLAALTAIIQTMLLEHYWEQDETEGKRRFLRLAEADHPVAMAIVNELSEEEFDAAFRWPGGTNRDRTKGLAATPVLAFLTEEQYERARVAAVAEDEGEQARGLAAEEPGRSRTGTHEVKERIRLAEKRFVAAMIEDLVSRRDEALDASAKATVEECIEAMPEPWKSRTRNELERIREDVAERLLDKSTDGR